MVSLISFIYAVKVIGGFYLVASFGKSKFIDITKEELLEVSHSELADIFLSLYAGHIEQSDMIWVFPQHAMYAVIALVTCLVISIIYNWRLSINT
jgi:hypothetical protein